MNHDDDELTPAERRELDTLSREIAPPGDHEDRTVAALKVRGLLGARRRPAALPRALAAAAAAVLLFAAGTAAGRWSSAGAAVSPDFILLLRAGSETPPESPDEEMRRVNEYASWAQDARRRGLLTGEKLADDGRFLGGGSAPGAAEHVQGYFLLHAASYEQAAALAATCPHVRYGGSIEVRRIERFTEETS